MGLRESRPKEPVIELESDISIFTFDDEKPEVKVGLVTGNSDAWNVGLGSYC